MAEPDPTSDLPRHTTPTWEVELLISGVAVFAMLQLPGWLDDRVFAVEPRLDADWRQILFLAYIYAKSATLILATTFVAHLLLRARWIALVGMHSVYPDGIRLDALHMGPIQRELEQAIDTPIPDRIESADNLATTVFAIGVMLAMMLAGIAIVAMAVYGASLMVATLSHGRIAATSAMLVVFAVIVVPFSLLVLIDRYLGARLPMEGRLRKTAKALLQVYSRIGFSRGGNTIMATLASHGGDRRAIVLTTAIMFVALAGSAWSMTLLRKPDMLGSYALFPQSETQRIDAAHYDDQRNPARDPATPYIQSAVVAGPYLKLVVPYRPERDDPAMRSLCPQAMATARLACLQSLHGAMLDGKPLADLRYEIASDPRTDRPALLAMLDVRALAPGRHELQVARPPRPGKADQDGLSFDRIAFWL